MLCSRMLKHRVVDGHADHGWLYRKTEPFFVALNTFYERALKGALRARWVVLGAALIFACIGPWLYTKLQRELTPLEDRGLFNVGFTAPDGSTPEYNQAYTVQMENMLLRIPEVERTVHQTGSGRGSISVQLKPWEERSRKTQDIIQDVTKQFRENITGGQATASAVRGISSGGGGRR